MTQTLFIVAIVALASWTNPAFCLDNSSLSKRQLSAACLETPQVIGGKDNFHCKGRSTCQANCKISYKLDLDIECLDGVWSVPGDCLKGPTLKLPAVQLHIGFRANNDPNIEMWVRAGEAAIANVVSSISKLGIPAAQVLVRTFVDPDPAVAQANVRISIVFHKTYPAASLASEATNQLNLLLGTSPETPSSDNALVKNIVATLKNAPAGLEAWSRAPAREILKYAVSASVWKAGEWEVCDNECGKGKGHRDVTCAAGAAVFCNAANQPISDVDCEGDRACRFYDNAAVQILSVCLGVVWIGFAIGYVRAAYKLKRRESEIEAQRSETESDRTATEKIPGDVKEQPVADAVSTMPEATSMRDLAASIAFPNPGEAHWYPVPSPRLQKVSVTPRVKGGTSKVPSPNSTGLASMTPRSTYSTPRSVQFVNKGANAVSQPDLQDGGYWRLHLGPSDEHKIVPKTHQPYFESVHCPQDQFRKSGPRFDQKPDLSNPGLRTAQSIPPRGMFPLAYPDKTVVEYFAPALSRWVPGLVMVASRDSNTQYDVKQTSGQVITDVPLDLMRLPLNPDEPVDVFTMRNGGAWLPGHVGPVGPKNAMLHGYTVLLDGCEPAQGVPSLKIRRRYEIGEKIWIYGGTKIGWIVGAVDLVVDDPEKIDRMSKVDPEKVDIVIDVQNVSVGDGYNEGKRHPLRSCGDICLWTWVSVVKETECEWIPSYLIRRM